VALAFLEVLIQVLLRLYSSATAASEAGHYVFLCILPSKSPLTPHKFSRATPPLTAEFTTAQRISRTSLHFQR